MTLPIVPTRFARWSRRVAAAAPLALASSTAALWSHTLLAQATTTPVSASIAARTTGMERRDGFIPIYLDPRQGRILLEIPRDSMRALLMITQATGLGSNPIGIDRGSSGETHVARFDHDGDRVLVVLENWAYRSSLGNADHARTVAEAFPPSTIASLPLLAEESGRLLVDATDMAMRDWNDVVGTLTRSQQGAYAVARDRSSIYKPYTRAFPDNTEIDVALTYAAATRAGSVMSAIVPDGRAFTLRQHLTLLRLPDAAGFHPRAQDPRVGYFGVSFRDYGRPIQEPLLVRWAARHRLERVNPNDPNSPIKEPIRYYVDRGIPEPIRTATLQGVKWWEEAFDRAGLKGGFKVELLPEGVDPMDARYNVVQWENRNERGWSVGGALTDPRTGEMVKGMARLDSHRARTDYNLYAGLMGADASAADTAFVLARVRQVSAHEVGHTLGLSHNYIASSYDRGSVMDYPPPRVRLRADGTIDLSQAYAVGPGPYDVWAIHWGYGVFGAGEADSLRAIVADGLKKGYLYLSDADARPEYGSDPRVSLWDDGATPLEFLKAQTDVRRVAMSRFGERNIRPGEPITLLQERFVPVYFMHRFALNGTSKTIGGMEYSNAVRGDGQQATRPVPYARQIEALKAMIAALRPEELAIPDTVLTLMAPNATTVSPSVELFGSRTRPAFDELGAAQTLSQMILDMIFERDRAARLVEFATRGAGPHLTLGATIDAVVGATWDGARPASAKLAALQRVTQRAVADRLLLLAADSEASPEVRAMAELKIRDLARRAKARQTSARTDDEQAHWLAIVDDLNRWIDKRELSKATLQAIAAPPGDPFGVP